MVVPPAERDENLRRQIRLDVQLPGWNADRPLAGPEARWFVAEPLDAARYPLTIVMDDDDGFADFVRRSDPGMVRDTSGLTEPRPRSIDPRAAGSSRRDVAVPDDQCIVSRRRAAGSRRYAWPAALSVQTQPQCRPK